MNVVCRTALFHIDASPVQRVCGHCNMRIGQLKALPIPPIYSSSPISTPHILSSLCILFSPTLFSLSIIFDPSHLLSFTSTMANNRLILLLHIEMPPLKRRRGLAGSIISTAVSAALIGSAVGLTVYRL